MDQVHRRLMEDALGQVERAEKRVPPPPPIIAGYRILSQLGQGGMGVVFLAEQPSPQRTVALKVLRPDVLSEKRVERFLLEAEFLGRLQHEGIARIFEAGFDPGTSQPYIAMEWIRDGVPIDTYVQGRRLALERRLQMIADACQAVHHAHQRSLVHRDLKPANVLVDDSERIKILDFGVARAIDSDVQLTTAEEGGATLIGTLAYMSPEQVEGDPDAIDIRTDVYALGVLTYELISGSLPHEVKGLSLAKAARRIQEEEARPLRMEDRKVPLDVKTIVEKALSKEKERRYASAAEMESDIRAFLNHQIIAARPPSAIYHIHRFGRRHRALVLGMIATFCALLIGLGMALHQRNRAVASSNIAEKEALKAKRLQAITMGLSAHEELDDLIAEAGTLWPRRPHLVAKMDTWLENAHGFVEGRETWQEQRLEIQAELRLLDDGEDPTGRQDLQWLDGKLEELIERIDGFGADGGLIDDVEYRATIASAMEEATCIQPRSEWEKVRRQVEANPAYQGLQLDPQMGLIPLDQDPDTGFWDFWFWESGERPRRDALRRGWHINGSTGMVFVLRPPGTLNIGGEQHRLEACFVSKYEMTQGQWMRIRKTNPSYYHPSGEGGSRSGIVSAHPVESVTALVVEETLRWLGLELPTVNEWRCIAMGGPAGIWFKTVKKHGLERFMNIADLSNQEVTGVVGHADWDDGYATTAPVGQFSKNPMGFYDVYGNVAELCAPQEDPGGLYYATVGGSFNIDYESLARFPESSRHYESAKSHDLGVRPVYRLR